MVNLAWLRTQIRRGHYVLTRHAETERMEEDIDILNVEEAILSGKILELYPSDPRGSSCLLLGWAAGRPLHVVGGRKKGWAVIITVYRPLPPHWITPEIRRKKESHDA